MAHTPLLTSLSSLARDTAEAQARGTDVDEVRTQRAERETSARGFTRRQFLGGLAAGAGLAAMPRAAWARKTQPRIAIVGGGLAGLNAALELGDHGITTTLFEAQTLGGRVRSEGPGAPGCGNCHGVPFQPADTWADRQVTELFGEFIDSDHQTLRHLAHRFHHKLINLLGAQPHGSEDAYYFFGQRYAASAAKRDFAAIYPALQADAAAGSSVSYAGGTADGLALDEMSVYDWIESRVPGGHASPLGQLLDVAYVIEYGAESRDQSALNLVLLLSGAKKHKFSMFGSSDEKFWIDGGNQSLIRSMAAAIQATCDVRTGSVLQSISRRASGDYQLDFAGGASFLADLVLLALPFAALRRVDYSRAGFDALKDMAIRELGASRNGKVYLQFNSRLWNQPGPWGIGNGNAYSDTGFQTTWDATRGQAGQSGILCKYTGGDNALAMHINHPYANIRNPTMSADALAFLLEVEPVFPGISALWNGRGSGTQPYLSPFFGSAYAYWKVGQYQTISGYEGVTQGGVLFAGEHTSIDFQGYMEGAAAEGERAAKEIIARCR